MLDDTHTQRKRIDSQRNFPSTERTQMQDKPEAEAVRAAQVRQLDRALTEIQRRWGLSPPAGGKEGRGKGEQGVPVVLMMDGNDTPHLSAYGPHRSSGGGSGGGGGGPHTPMYRALTQELGWRDCLGEGFGPTSITLARRLRIDYILAKGGDLRGAEATPALEVRLAGMDKAGKKVLVSREEEGARAVYGLPLPAVGDQPCVPSDHLHVSARLTFGMKEAAVPEKEKDMGGGEGQPSKEEM